MIRTIGAIVFVVLFLVLSLPVLGLEWLYAKINKKGADITSLRIVQWAFQMVLAICGTKVIVKGEENVISNVPVLYIGNHRSYFDIVIGYSRCPNLTGFISKDTFKKIPILRTWMERLYCLFLDRSNTRDGLRVVLTAIDYIKRGISIYVCPEGTRTRTGEMAPFKEGTFKIATKTGCPIIPVAFSNTDDIFEKHIPWIKKTTVVIHYGEPIYPDSLEGDDKKHIGAYTQQAIAGMLEEDKELF
ncbi:MAG: lysophospholipid acyltransferase family protein [Lachnospiraceae bacterium]|nr:lysophospholipid acyltransferase family protein [Lachnospiraceae bacterium]